MDTPVILLALSIAAWSAIWLTCDALVAIYAARHQLSPALFFVLSLLLSPIAGLLIAVALRRRKADQGNDPSSQAAGHGVYSVTLLAGIAAVVFIGIGGALITTYSLQRANTGSHSTKWEYIVATPSDMELRTEMDYLGKQGWQLTFARRAINANGMGAYEMIFKRPLHSSQSGTN